MHGTYTQTYKVYIKIVNKYLYLKWLLRGASFSFTF